LGINIILRGDKNEKTVYGIAFGLSALFYFWLPEG
jgi:hypothetical protein